ncbi:MAG: AEC family transporter [Bdellovibrionales bacterium]|jgi:predicted permease|nr:AEC family transporter [Bdellovibrionales bacterium]
MNPSFVLIFCCLLIGLALRFSGKFPKSTPQSMNLLVIWVSLPAVVLIQIPRLMEKLSKLDSFFSADILIPISMAWLLFGLSYTLFSILGRLRNWPESRTGALILTAGLGNTAFVGFAVLDSLIGNEALQIAVLVDQLGSFFVLSTVGILFAASRSPKKHDPASEPSAGARVETPLYLRILKSILLFPPFLALIAAVLWWTTGTSQNEQVVFILEKFAATLVPLALTAVGFQLKVSRETLALKWRPLAAGLLFKLFIGPLALAGLYMIALDNHSLASRVAILEAAMAPMITAAIVAEEFGFDRDIANLMVGIGIPLSLGTVYIWHILL